ncbi:hypothetical protein GCM10011586_20300 [Silvibacterium dinghuense]|nr:hypothetical protein GCM10011586_20300 [Silvibacterium dinghuense]
MRRLMAAGATGAASAGSELQARRTKESLAETEAQRRRGMSRGSGKEMKGNRRDLRLSRVIQYGYVVYNNGFIASGEHRAVIDSMAPVRTCPVPYRLEWNGD